MNVVHAYEIPETNLTLMVGTFDNARRPVLAVKGEYGVRVMASFHSEDAAEAVVLMLDQMVGAINRVVAHYAVLHGETIHDDRRTEGPIQDEGAAGPRAPERPADLEGRGGEPNA